MTTFFATPIAINNLKKAASQIVPLYVSLLDSRTNLFSDRSSVFSNPDCLQLKDLAFKLCNYYGTEIVSHELSAAEAYMKSHPLGFADGQHLFGFYFPSESFVLQSMGWLKTLFGKALAVRKLYKINAPLSLGFPNGRKIVRVKIL